MGSMGDVNVHDVTITGYTVTDIRFPTSLDGIGSDAMHKGTNGSHPYVQLHTNQPGLTGEGIVSRPGLQHALPRLIEYI
jgi:L-galactonate dehydratase